MAIEVLTYYFDEFTKKHYDKIQRGLNLNDEAIQGCYQTDHKTQSKTRRQCR